MVKEYKDWLFVRISNEAKEIELHNEPFPVMDYYLGEYKGIAQEIFLPPGSYHIIGKGDEIDWEGIVEKYPSTSDCYQDYGRHVFGDDVSLTPTESGHSLLRSLEMEPGTTLILKKL